MEVGVYSSVLCRNPYQLKYYANIPFDWIFERHGSKFSLNGSIYASIQVIAGNSRCECFSNRLISVRYVAKLDRIPGSNSYVDLSAADDSIVSSLNSGSTYKRIDDLYPLTVDTRRRNSFSLM